MTFFSAAENDSFADLYISGLLYIVARMARYLRRKLKLGIQCWVPYSLWWSVDWMGALHGNCWRRGVAFLCYVALWGCENLSRLDMI